MDSDLFALAFVFAGTAVASLEFVARTAFAFLAVVVLAAFAAVTLAVAGIAVEALVATLEVAGNAVAAFDVALGDSSSSSSRGPILIVTGDMDTSRTEFSLSCASSCASPSPCAFGWNRCALGLRNWEVLGLRALEQALELGEVGA